MNKGVPENITALLAFEDGSAFWGRSVGAPGEAFGEAVFNTAMTGYQEILTDPSYLAQIVVMTYPHIGNYGVTAQDNESGIARLRALVAREICLKPSNWESQESLPRCLARNRVVAVDGVDTRAITLLLREKGALRAAASTLDLDPKSLSARARREPGLKGADLASAASCAKIYVWSRGRSAKPRIVVYDFGLKRGILRRLADLGARVIVVPAQTPAQDALALSPDGVVLSSGPGDPAAAPYAVQTVKRLLHARVPILGICLGHQFLALALGAKIYKLKFGHHGANHPVKDLETGRTAVTTQNHDFSVAAASLPPCARATHSSLNDGSLEGLAHRELPAFSVQFHPEAAPGPRESLDAFARFFRMCAARGKKALSRA
ncbi:MAG: glutamine-hydrolyzing carbamoyl-phosphate synthase small subunit [Elusimicrobiota bacterium]